MLNEETIKVALTALLHDIGKFWQRAFWGEERCPHDQQGADWVESCLVPRLTFLTTEDQHDLVEAIRQHHEHPYLRNARVVIIADRLASGERLKRQDEETGDPSRDPLISIFTSVNLLGRQKVTKQWGYSTKPLALDRESIFPVPVEQAQVDYASLWGSFEGEIKTLHPSALSDAKTALVTLYAVIRKYVWCVPAAVYKNEPDVSLADHLRITAAIASCVAEFDNDKLNRFEEVTEQGVFPEDQACLLIGGDVSGIQKFLYTISSEGAAKSLRGRSTYLSLISETVVQFLLRELHLPLTNLIYCSGGHFYLLAPLSAQDKVSNLSQKATGILLDIHGGDLGVILDTVTLTGQDFSVKLRKLPDKWYELTRKLGEQKNRRLYKFIENRFATVLGPFSSGGLQSRCAVCHGEKATLSGIEREIMIWREGEPEKCSLCESFEELGDDIAKRSALLTILPRTASPERSLKWHSVLAMLGFELWLCDDERLQKKFDRDALVVRINQPDLQPQDSLPVHDFRWMPNFTPRGEDGTILELEQIAKNSEGVSYWAALTMDVDNLGQIFQHGLGRSYSLSRVSTLSSMLSLFFEGYLNNICTDVDPERRRLYLLYSGGDDLLLVGSWNKVVEVAQRIHDELSDFTCRNPSLTVSAGISLHHPKFPLYQAAADAKENLDAAKRFDKHPDGHEKDASGFFGQVVSWEDVRWLRKWRDVLFDLIEHGKSHNAGEKVKLSRGFLFKLASIANIVRQQEQAEKKRQFSLSDISRLVHRHKAKWRLVYSLAREPRAFRTELEQLQEELLRDNSKHLAQLNVLVRWVELSTRKEGGE